MGPATLRTVFTIREVKDARDCVLTLPGECWVSRTGRGVDFAKGCISQIEVNCSRRGRTKFCAAQMIRMAVVQQAAGVVNGQSTARQRYKTFLKILAIHQGKFQALWTVNDLRVASGTILLHHSSEGIIGKIYGIDRNRPARRVHTVGVRAIAEDVSIRVVRDSRARNTDVAIRGVTAGVFVGRLETLSSRFRQISKCVIGKRLGPDSAAIDAREAGQIVVRVATILLVSAVEGISDVLGGERVIGVPCEDTRE